MHAQTKIPTISMICPIHAYISLVLFAGGREAERQLKPSTMQNHLTMQRQRATNPPTTWTFQWELKIQIMAWALGRSLKTMCMTNLFKLCMRNPTRNPPKTTMPIMVIDLTTPLSSFGFPLIAAKLPRYRVLLQLSPLLLQLYPNHNLCCPIVYFWITQL